MSQESRDIERIRHLDELLEIQDENLADHERQLALAGLGSAQTSLKQIIKRDIRPAIRKLEQEQADLLARVSRPEQIAESEALTVCTELAEGVATLQAAKQPDWPEEMLRKLDEIQKVLAEPSKAATAKLKASFPIVPGLVSCELELDIESTLKQVWGKIKALFRKGIHESPQ